ncbi:hypothetical protein PBI_THONKO_96 [Mycobacterium phage Thonko]|uniref:Uncharacterized protein n=1 Tax=Mycobacterium phage Thonko TaxID=2282910 RepID=A0A346FCE1_9CAUD|nr:hypothetical protein I5G57_gp096 [Mycobacterium phage Thonko]AXN53366.1 hypothetical protein PBI_THONKO_96 [Mycobacterium phage Thonko]
MSQITAVAADNVMAVFAGQTVTHDEVLAQISLVYATERKRTGVTSYFKVTDEIERRGVTSRYTGPDYTGTCLFTFPHKTI